MKFNSFSKSNAIKFSMQIILQFYENWMKCFKDFVYLNTLIENKLSISVKSKIQGELLLYFVVKPKWLLL